MCVCASVRGRGWVYKVPACWEMCAKIQLIIFLRSISCPLMISPQNLSYTPFAILTSFRI
jgi:hypothetical protein